MVTGSNMDKEQDLDGIASSFLAEQSNASPEMLWHYTNTKGMLGILRSGKIWATHMQFLNDASEMQYAGDQLRRAIFNNKQKVSSDLQFLQDLLNTIRNYLSLHICVVSFSETKNELSQWRAYGGESGSFALGFKPKMLKDYSNKQKSAVFKLYKCFYGEPEKPEHPAKCEICEKFVSAALREFHQVAKTQKDTTEMIRSICEKAGKKFLEIAPLIKHPDFKQEAEWRLVSGILDLETKPIHFREGKTCAVPYTEFSLIDEVSENTAPANFRNCVQVLIGPPQAHSPRGPVNGLLGYCADFKLQPLQVESSSTPYRDI